MYVHVDPESIKVEIRCHKCDAVMHIYNQYESNDILTIEVGLCDECKEEDYLEEHDVNRHIKR